jgi:hypothetical protein
MAETAGPATTASAARAMRVAGRERSVSGFHQRRNGTTAKRISGMLQAASRVATTGASPETRLAARLAV